MELVRKPLLQGLADAEQGVLAQLALQVVADALRCGSGDAQFHHLRVTAWRVPGGELIKRRLRPDLNAVLIELWLRGHDGVIARARLVVNRSTDRSFIATYINGYFMPCVM